MLMCFHAMRRERRGQEPERVRELRSDTSLGMGQNETTRTWTADVCLRFHLPGFHFGYLVLTHRHFSRERMHYYNPSLHTGVTDSSGVRISLADSVRAYDAGAFRFNGGTDARRAAPKDAGAATTPICLRICVFLPLLVLKGICHYWKYSYLF